MQDQSRRLAEPLTWGRRERALVGTLLAIVVIAICAMGVYALTSGSSSRSDCIQATFASTLGAAQIHACGGRARQICASPARLGGVRTQIEESCRKAGFAVGAG